MPLCFKLHVVLVSFPRAAIRNCNRLADLKQQQHILSPFWTPGIQNQSTGTVGSFCRLWGRIISLPNPASGGSRGSRVWGSITLISASFTCMAFFSVSCLFLSLLQQGHLSLGMGPTIIQDDLISTILITSATTLFPINSHVQMRKIHRFRMNIFWQGSPFN